MADRKGYVMIVEDSPTQSARLRRLLEEEDLEVVEAASAELALEQLEIRRPDAIILDYNLPGMNGGEFCRDIRMNASTRSIPVLMLTAKESDVAQMEGLESGADDYVSKSSDPDILRVRVRSLVRKAESNATVQEPDHRFSRVRILAIDDSPTYLYSIKKELQKEHYLVETAESPAEGLALLNAGTFDCVLIDFEMPGLSGAEVCRRIRELRGEANPEVVLIMLSSHEDKERMAISFEAGADDYISKSSDFSVIRSRIRALVRRKFMVDENRRVSIEIQERELEVVRERAEREAAEVRATMADQLAAANRELDRANQELEYFAYSAAHDLREPLRIVCACSEMLQQTYRGKLDDQADQLIGYCVEASGRMDRLIQDLLDYARAAKGGSTAAKPVDLNSIVDEVVVILQTAINDAGAEVSKAQLPTLAVEAIRIQQVFQNLIGNAINYRRPDTPPRIHVSAVRQDGEWVLSVADNGVGIAPENRERVFKIFERLERGQSGSGLGLAICKRVVEGLGGRIWVESEVGVGSTFKFTLPVHLEAKARSVL